MLNVKYKYADLFFVTEQIPNLLSNVSLSEIKDKYGYPIAKINWQVLDSEIELMNQWGDLLQKVVFNSPEYKFTHEHKDINWNNIFTSAAHHVGTARMGESSETGVVDKNLKVFDVNNLFICDGSVFPTSGNVNSGFTISALACKLSNHLKNIQIKN